MADSSQLFADFMGPPEREVPDGLKLPSKAYADVYAWKNGVYPTIKAGWWMDHFLFLFGEGVDTLEDCLEAWDFIVPEATRADRMLVGRNAYGAILVATGLLGPSEQKRLAVLDPLGPSWFVDRNLNLFSFICNWIPRQRMGKFMDDRIYREWRESTGESLADDEILAPIVPLSLGGKFELSNFSRQNLFEYYRFTGQTHREAWEKHRSEPRSDGQDP